MASRSYFLGFLLAEITSWCAGEVTQKTPRDSSIALQVLSAKETLLVSHCPQVCGTKSFTLLKVWEKEEGGHILGINMLTTRVDAFNMIYRLWLQF